MNHERYKPKGWYFKPHIFSPNELIGLYVWLLFAVGTLFNFPPLNNDYRISVSMRLVMIFGGAFVLCVGYAALRIGYYYFKKRFIKPKPEEDEPPMPNWPE